MGQPKGCIPWNKGLKGGQVSWSKGLTKETCASLRSTSQKLMGHQKFGDCGKYIRTPEFQVRYKTMLKSNRRSYIGENNPNYRGGVSSFAYGDIWTTEQKKEWKEIRMQCFIRDGFKCQICGTKHKIQVHHIILYRIIKEHKLEHLITLCKYHHRKADNYMRRREYQDIVRTANINEIAELGRNILTLVKNEYELTNLRLDADFFNRPSSIADSIQDDYL